MPTTAIRTEQFIAITGLPDFLIPWADRFYESQEIELINIMNRDVLDAAAAQARWESEPDSLFDKLVS